MSPRPLQCENCGAEIMPAMIRCRHCNWRRSASGAGNPAAPAESAPAERIDGPLDEPPRPHAVSHREQDAVRSAAEPARYKVSGDDLSSSVLSRSSGVDTSLLTATCESDTHAPAIDNEDDVDMSRLPPRRWTWRDLIPDIIYGLASDRTLALVGGALVTVGIIAGGAWWGPFSNADGVNPALNIRPGAVRGFITSLSIADNGILAAGRTHGQVEIWDVNTRQLIESLATVRGKYVALGPNAACVVAGDEQQSRVYDLAADAVSGRDMGIRSLAVNGAGTHAVSVDSERRVLIWDLERGGIHAKLPPRSGEVTATALGPEGAQCAFGTRAGKIMVVDVASRAVVREIGIHQCGAITALAFDPGGTRIAAATADNRLHVMTGQIYDQHWGQAFSPGIPLVARVYWVVEDRLLVAGGRQFALCRPQTKPDAFTADLQSIDSLAVSPDGRLAALGCRDEPAIVLHDLTTGQRIGILDVDRK